MNIQMNFNMLLIITLNSFQIVYIFTMTKYSYFLQVFLQIIFAQNIISSDIFQFKYRDLQKLLDNSENAETNNQLEHLEHILSFDGAFVSISII